MSTPASLWAAAAGRFWRDRRAAAGSVAFGIILLGCVLGPLWVPYAPDAPDIGHAAAAPGLATGHVLGTDAQARDVLARSLTGGRATLLLAIGAGVFSLALGYAVGAATGYPGGRGARGLLALGVGLLALVILGVLLAWLGAARLRLLVGAGVLGWAYAANVVRIHAGALRRSAFADAARLASAPPWAMVRRHVLPNLAGTIFLCGLLATAVAVLMEPVMTGIGLGLPPPAVSWGVQLQENAAAEAPWALAVPVLLGLAVLASLNAMRLGLRDALQLRR